MFKRLRRPLTLALSREGRGNNILRSLFYSFSLEGGPRRQKVGMRVKATNSVFKRLRRSPHPGPLPQGEREFECFGLEPCYFADAGVHFRSVDVADRAGVTGYFGFHRRCIQFSRRIALTGENQL